MLVSDLNSYLAERQRVTMADLANRFDASPEALRGMLELLIAKGRVVRDQVGITCNGCTKCDPAAMEIYLWRGRA